MTLELRVGEVIIDNMTILLNSEEDVLKYPIFNQKMGIYKLYEQNI